MKKKGLVLIVAAAGLGLLLAGCRLETGPAAGGDVQREEDPSREIEFKVQELLLLVTWAQQTGDRGGLDDFLEKEDRSGELRPLVEDALGEAKAQADLQPRAASFDLGEKLALLADGDVLLFAAPLNILDAAVANIYDHAGLVDAQRLNPLQPSIPCVVSATPAMEFPPPVIYGDGGDFPDPQDGVRYQSPAELSDEFPTWTRLSVKGGIPAGYGDWSASFTSRYTATNTAYSNFQPLGGRLTLSPIRREDSRYWYCSKVPWRIYHDFPARTNLEYGGRDGVADPAGSMDFYSGKRWVSQKLTLLHLFYLIMASVAYGPIEGYEMIDEDQREILTELVSPDELRADAGEYSRIETWGSSEAVRELERNWEEWTDDLGLAEP